MVFRSSGSAFLIRRIPRRVMRPQPGRNALPGNVSLRIARRPPAPPYWRNIAPFLRASPYADERADGPERYRHWLLVLQAKRFRYRFFERAAPVALYVPPLAAQTALHEILAFEKERPPLPFPQPVARRGLYWYAVLLAALVPWHRARWDGLFSFAALPANARDWLHAGGLDAYRVSVAGEWWRAVTSLTLHADAAHLVSNLVMGILFGIPLCRHTGVGFGFLLTILAASLGNLATAYLRPASFLSQGFSTAVFASVGLLAAFAARHAAATAATGTAGAVGATQHRRRTALKEGLLKALPPLGAGLGFLAMLGGSDAPAVDYLAHTMGLAAGVILGLATAFAFPRLLTLRGARNTALQGVSLFLAAGLLVLCWRMAW